MHVTPVHPVHSNIFILTFVMTELGMRLNFPGEDVKILFKHNANVCDYARPYHTLFLVALCLTTRCKVRSRKLSLGLPRI